MGQRTLPADLRCTRDRKSRLNIFRFQPGALGDACEHLGANLFAVMKGPGEARITFAYELAVRAFADASILSPADAQESLQDFPCP